MSCSCRRRNMNLQPSQTWQLLKEPADRSSLSAGPRFEKLDVPAAGPSYVCQPAGGPTQVSGVVPIALGDSFILEPLIVGHQAYLLLLSPGDARPRVNGLAAPVVCLLSVKDQVQFGPD